MRAQRRLFLIEPPPKLPKTMRQQLKKEVVRFGHVTQESGRRDDAAFEKEARKRTCVAVEIGVINAVHATAGARAREGGETPRVEISYTFGLPMMSFM